MDRLASDPRGLSACCGIAGAIALRTARSRPLFPIFSLTIGDLFHPPTSYGGTMAKGDQRSSKMDKKPKKDTAPPKPITSDRPSPPVTAVMPRGKLKNK